MWNPDAACCQLDGHCENGEGKSLNELLANILGGLGGSCKGPASFEIARVSRGKRYAPVLGDRLRAPSLAKFCLLVGKERSHHPPITEMSSWKRKRGQVYPELTICLCPSLDDITVSWHHRMEFANEGKGCQRVRKSAVRCMGVSGRLLQPEPIVTWQQEQGMSRPWVHVPKWQWVPYMHTQVSKSSLEGCIGYRSAGQRAVMHKWVSPCSRGALVTGLQVSMLWLAPRSPLPIPLTHVGATRTHA